MAQFVSYKCKSCGYKVQTEPTGHYGLMSGEYYNFRCDNCKNIVSIHVDDLAQEYYMPKCPHCEAVDRHLHTWNPIDGHCPRCNGRMIYDPEGGVCMAD